MAASTRIVVDEHEPEIDIVEPPFSPRPDVVPRKDKSFTDEFVVVDFLGRGKFGEVKRCRELATGREFAAKFIATPRPQDKTDVEQEISTMRRLHHRRIVQLYDAFETKKEMCLILEIVYGGELFDRVITDDFLLTEKACICIVRQICEGVKFIHSHNIIHLDMKPENILCLSKTSNRIKIIDFGLARDYNPKSDTRVLFGTPEFMAPEVIQYDPIDFSTDMWSIGVICYVLLSGLSPFLGDNDHDTLGNVIRGRYGFDFPEFKDVSNEAKDMISRLLVTDKKKRISASQCLEHPWLKATPKPSTPTLDLSKIQLKHFVYQRKWQKAVNALIALKRMGVNIRPVQNGKSCSNVPDIARDVVEVYHPTSSPDPSCSPSNKNKNIVSKQPINAVVVSAPSTAVRPSQLQTKPQLSSTSHRTRPSLISSVSTSTCTTPSASVTSPTSSTAHGKLQAVDSKLSPEAPINGSAVISTGDDDGQLTPGATNNILNRRTCHKASETPETFGNGHVFNLSKMIQMNRASHQHEEPSPVEIWQRDCRIAGGGTLGRRQKQQQQPESSSKMTCATSVDDISRIAAKITSDTVGSGSLSSTNHRIRNGSCLPTVNDSAEATVDCDDVEDVWNVCATVASNGVRSQQPPPPPSHSFTGGGNNGFVRNQQRVPLPHSPGVHQQTGDRDLGRVTSGCSTTKTQLGVSTTSSMNGSSSVKNTASSPPVVEVWSSQQQQQQQLQLKQNTINAAGKSTKATASPTHNNATTSTTGAKTTTAKDVALIKDRVRFFTKSDSTQSPPISTTATTTTPTKSMSWFKRSNLFK